ncbi:MAG: hypothetical protein R6U64_00265 [Bacteroidales bacterium]
MKKFTILILFTGFFLSAQAQWSVDISSGLAFQSYNDVRVPNETGTFFSFEDDFEIQGPVIPLRIRLGYTFAEKNHLFALYAPLSVEYTGMPVFDISFEGSLFAAGQETEGLYKFNSYRLTYRRDVLLSDSWVVGVGFTAKIRDARIRLTTDDLTNKKDDVGFVPLLHLYFSYRQGPWEVFLEGDGLAGGPGRAFDFLLAAQANPWEFMSVYLGYRVLEGGANVDEVYNFAWINFLSAGVVFRLVP